MQSKTILFHPDVSSSVGAGHLMRCLAVAEQCRQKGLAPFFSVASSNGVVQSILGDRGIPIHNVENLEKTVQATSAGIVVIDSYKTTAEDIDRLRRQGIAVVVYMDTPLFRCTADLLIDQNINADEKKYDCASYTRTLKGLQFAALRSEFHPELRRQSWDLKSPVRILVTLGGAPDRLLMKKVMQAFSKIDRPLSLTVATGVYGQEGRTEFLTSSIVQAMTEADVAVSAAGSTCWELSFLGIPALYLTLADNQKGIAEKLEKAGAGIHLGGDETFTPNSLGEAVDQVLQNRSLRESMGRAGMQLVDGRGAERVAEVIQGLSNEHVTYH